MPNFIDLSEKIKDLKTDLKDHEISDELSQRIKKLRTDIDTQREGTAAFLAYAVSVAFCVIIAFPLLFIFLFRFLDPGISEFIKSVLPSITTLLGVAFGFYFSEKRLEK